MTSLSDLMKRMKVPDQGIPANGYDCTICRDTGFEDVTDAQGHRRVQRCTNCEERRRGFAPGVPDEEQQTRLTHYTDGKYDNGPDQRDALLHAKYFLDDVHPGLYLYGGVGSGKTALACAILNELHKAGKSVRFIRVSDLLQKLVQEAGDAAYQRVVEIPILCLDDIGAQKPTDYARQMLIVIFDLRCDAGRRTIWTSNLDLDELTEFFGEDRRISSRIAGHCKVVGLDGKDYRTMKARKRAGR